MKGFDKKHIRIIDIPVEDDGSGLMYRENGKFYQVSPEHPSVRPKPDGYKDIEAAHVMVANRTYLLFVPVQEAQKLIEEKIKKIVEFKKKRQ